MTCTYEIFLRLLRNGSKYLSVYFHTSYGNPYNSEGTGLERYRYSRLHYPLLIALSHYAFLNEPLNQVTNLENDGKEREVKLYECGIRCPRTSAPCMHPLYQDTAISIRFQLLVSRIHLGQVN
ncbi:9718_t:CDS:1 [Acaulospora morrowiae]|uniref:9718_t:CDS:1 n=1 Tax=Acaulospora morrowiae TaxID=94023 RepID=A0A9N8ZS28_9GLOM|nr:9718_t:CDS:1 [Acaulospora morrowiae]